MARRRASSTPRLPARAMAAARDRLKRLRARVRERGASHAVIASPVDVGYLTGFLGGDSVLIVGPGKPALLSDGRYLEELEPFKAIATIVMRDGSMTDAIADRLASEHGAGRVGGVLLQAEHTSLASDAALRKACARRVPARLIDAASGLVGPLREVKDAAEIRAISAAIRLQEEALLAAFEYFTPGMTELEFTAELEYQMKSRGASGPAFGTIVAAGANGSLPHYRPSHTPIRRGEPLLIDWGAVLDGYRGDMTRVFAVGRWSRQMREIYSVVLEAHEAAAAALRPGVTGAEVDAVARKVIAAAGYGEAFSHGLGHGLGLETHEQPRLSRLSRSDVLEAGHVVTIEPGIYLPGVGGVRIEDDYAVTGRGRRNLSSLPKDIDWASL